MGRIRLQETRAVSSTEEQLSLENCHALFSLAADRFLLGETSDILITEYSCLRSEIEGIQPPGYEIGIRWLLLEDVIRFSPVRADDVWAFEADAHKAHVAVGEASFESQWSQWFKNQLADQACINGLILRRALGFGHSSNPQDAVSSSWGALARQIAVADAENSDTSDFSANFLRSRGRLFDLVREDADSGAFLVSCPIEWINLRSDTNIFDTDPDLAEQAHRLHEKYLNVTFDPSLAHAEDIKQFETLLLSKAPEAFPGAWSPAMISLYVRYSHRIRFGSSAPDDIISAVRAIDTSNSYRSAELLSFLLGIALGSNKTHSLERILHQHRFKVDKPSTNLMAKDMPSDAMMSQETVISLIQHCQANDRICPLPDHWNQLWEMLPEKQRDDSGWLPPLPLILAAWWSSAPLAKAARLQEHIEWAHKHNALDQVSKFLRALPESAWFHIGD